MDEVLLNRREDSERLKNLSTTLSYKVEAKGKDRNEIAFFAKFVLCSNNEYLPVIIDAGETRYWVRKIERLQSDDTDFLQKLKAEIPAFLHFLQHRQLSTEKESRMWFAPSLLHTEALQKIIRSNRNRLEIEMHELILDIMESIRHGHFLVLLWRHSSFVGKLTGKSRETPSKKGCAGVLETDTCKQRTDLYHLPIQLQSGVQV